MNLSMSGRPPVSTQQQLKRNRQTKKRAEALAKRFGTQILKTTGRTCGVLTSCGRWPIGWMSLPH